jgi:hypothetical protein
MTENGKRSHQKAQDLGISGRAPVVSANQTLSDIHTFAFESVEPREPTLNIFGSVALALISIFSFCLSFVYSFQIVLIAVSL